MTDYMHRAAELIAKAAENNETTFGPQAQRRCNWETSRELMANRYHENALRFADAYSTLAAIERDQVPAGLVKTILDALPTTC